MAISVAKPTVQPTISVARPTVPPNLALASRPSSSSFASGLAKFAGGAAQILAPTSPVTPPVLASASAPAVVKPPTLDLAALQAKARADAESAVNPYYTKQLNDFLAQQAASKERQQTIYDTSVKNLQDQLDQTLQGNETTKARTTQDVGQNQADINQNADVFQTDTGTAADVNRLALARDVARSGSTGGLGAQRLEQAQSQRNTTENRQEQQFAGQRQQQELFKTRTFEDLARSGELATSATEKGKKAAKFDLDGFIQGSGFDEQNKRSSLETDRLAAIGREQGNQAKLAFNNYLANIRDPAQLLAASQVYGGAF